MKHRCNPAIYNCHNIKEARQFLNHIFTLPAEIIAVTLTAALIIFAVILAVAYWAARPHMGAQRVLGATSDTPADRVLSRMSGTRQSRQS